MNKIAIITDTDSSIPAALAQKYAIQQVPITIHFEDQSYTTGIDIDDRLVFQIIDQRNKLPTTSAPSPAAFGAAYQRAFDDGAESIICICVSSKVSATYSAAVSACELFPDRDISVIDSLHLSIGQGFMVLAAAEIIASGGSKEEAIAAAVDTGSRAHVFALLSTLKYLALSGRVGKLAAGMADTLNIKPILTVREGKLELLEKIRTRKKAIERMLELTRQVAADKTIERAAIIHVAYPEGAQELRNMLSQVLPLPKEVLVAEFTAGLSVHAGSGVVGVCLVTSK